MKTSVKTTQIEKKYKTKNGEQKVITIDYAKVKDRLLAFWADCPRGSIETSQKRDTDGKTIFKAVIVKDQSEEYSRKATGHAKDGDSGVKSFEKLETIAVGRALALLGYAVTGEIASSEEMERFNAYKDEKRDEAIAQIKACQSMEALKECWTNIGKFVKDKDVIGAKNEMKAKLTQPKNENN